MKRFLALSSVMMFLGGIAIPSYVAGDAKVSGSFDIQYRYGDTFKSAGDDGFKIEELYLQVKAELGEGVAGLLKLDGADMNKGKPSHKYVEEAQIIVKNVGGSPLTIVFGKDEMPFGQDYDSFQFDSLVHEFEIDKVWGLNCGYKIDGLGKVEAAVWEQDFTGTVSIYENITARLTVKAVENLTAKISYAKLKNPATDGKDETRISIGAVYKYQGLVAHGEYTLQENPLKRIKADKGRGEKPNLITIGAEYSFSDLPWKVKARYEIYDDDDSAKDTIEGAYVIGVDYKLGKKTKLMVEYQNVLGEGAEEDKADIGVGVKAKF
jgi:hypothetical protein